MWNSACAFYYSRLELSVKNKFTFPVENNSHRVVIPFLFDLQFYSEFCFNAETMFLLLLYCNIPTFFIEHKFFHNVLIFRKGVVKAATGH